jgi:mannose-6-phosphate isomerase-like protein (cupin superfamily)
VILHDLKQMKGGWFIGDFEPTCLTTRDFEVAVKHYRAGDRESPHVHLVGREYTVIVEGHARMNDLDVLAGTIVEIPPGEAVGFESVTDVTTVVVKTPSVAGDKYPTGGVVSCAP